MSTSKKIKKAVRDGYSKIAVQGTSCCSAGSCCASSNSARDVSKTVGYSDEEVNVVPEGSNLGLGCGNPVALAAIKEDDVVLDLGSGAGFDAFLAAQKVGKKGRVIGVDMTPEMIERAKQNAGKGGYGHVEFRLGEIEKLPVEDRSVDLIISNCVINLSPDKETVFKEAFRVLKKGGSLMLSDLVLTKELPDAIKKSVAAYVGCIAGAMQKSDYLGLIAKAGFREIKVIGESAYPVGALFDGLESAEDAVASIKVTARK